jgi:hypothetical protein
LARISTTSTDEHDASATSSISEGLTPTPSCSPDSTTLWLLEPIPTKLSPPIHFTVADPICVVLWLKKKEKD